MISRALLIALCWTYAATSLTPLTSPDDEDCALYLTGRSSAYDYSLNLLKGNFGYDGQHTCITYEAVNQAYLDARSRILVQQPKGDWGPEDFASVGELILDISITLARTYGLNYEEIEKGLPLIDTSRTLIREVCPPVFSRVECRAGKYRRLDGLCNNLHQPTWGATMAPFQRLIGPLFADGINAPRISHSGRDLPLSRVVSRTMHPDDGFHDHAGTVMVIAWGQFMDHDYTLTGTPLDPINRNDPEECCKRPPHLKHPYCNEIRIPDDDYFYRLFGVKCIDFVRGFPSPRPGCRLGSRVPFNTLTGAIDGNTVYGVTEKFARKLRTGYGGLLRMNPVFKEYGLKDLLPLKLDIPDEGCTRPNKNMYCFEAGEIRVNEQLVLTVMHTLMAREHNRVANALAAVNPHWDDETLYQEARRINIAEIQHITYNEFLPILLGKDVMEKFGLVLEKEGYWDGYDPQVNPDVLDAFAAAAYRFGHSLLPTAVERWSKAHKFIASKRLSDLIRRPYDLYRAGVLDEYVMGLMNQVAQAMDDSITQEVTNHLFKKIGARFGMDLVSFNMQRGREFGLPGYMEFRKFCGLSGADSFQDLFGSMPNGTIRRYESIFEHPIDVDLWSGGVSERPLPGSMLGPTFACIIATQFSYSRRGDRFWFELPNQPSSFTPEQMVEIRKSRLARIICDNTDIIDTVQLYPMVLPDHELNPRVPCRSGVLPSMDFSKWAEPAPQFGAAKQYMTEATVTNQSYGCHLQNYTSEKGTNNSNCLIEKRIKNNNTNNTKSINITTDTITHLEESVKMNITPINLMPLSNFNSNNIKNKSVIFNNVYKNIETAIREKMRGHSKNSLRRKKRSPVIKDQNPTKSTSANLHDLKEKEEFVELHNTVSTIQKENLANYNIETLHVNVDPEKHLNDKYNITTKLNVRTPITENRTKDTYDNDEFTQTENSNLQKNIYMESQENLSSIEHFETNKQSQDNANRDIRSDPKLKYGSTFIDNSDEENGETDVNYTSPQLFDKTNKKFLVEKNLDNINNDKFGDGDDESELSEEIIKENNNLPIGISTIGNSILQNMKNSLNNNVVHETINVTYIEDKKRTDKNNGKMKYVNDMDTNNMKDKLNFEFHNESPNVIVTNQKNEIKYDPELVNEDISTNVKQQYEEIPLNYNHNKKAHKINNPLILDIDKIDTNDDNDESNKEHKYDENLNFKFGDITVNLPEIKLPDDVLEYAYEPINSNEDESRTDFQKQTWARPVNNLDNDSENHSHEINNNPGDKYLQLKHSEEDNEGNTNDEDDEDLYEKFVRERFGKSGIFKKRSEQLRTEPAIENQHLYNTLQNVLRKTKEIEKETENNEDPKAGYLWTLEYGENIR